MAHGCHCTTKNSHGTTKYLTAEVNFTAEVLRLPLACCMLIKAKMAESGDFEDGDLELPEDVDDEGGLIRYYFFLEASSTKKFVCFC